MKRVLVIASLILSMSLVAPAFAYTGSVDFSELFKYSDQKNANLETALVSISHSFKDNSVPVTQELLAAIIATLDKEVGENYLPVEEGGDYGMGASCTYKVKSSCRSTPYDGGADYKGRGYIQITGKSNYQTYCGSDCVGTSAPDLDICGCKNQWQCTDTDTASCPQAKALQPDYAAKIFASYYVKNNLVSQSNAKSYWNVGKEINGGEAYASDFNNKANTYLTLFQNNPDKASRLLTRLNSGTSDMGAVSAPNAAVSNKQPLPITISPYLDSGLVHTRNFKFKPWGQYFAIEYLSELYFAAYDPMVTADMVDARANAAFLHAYSRNRNLVTNGQVSKILTDDDAEMKINSNSPLKLKEGYELAIKYFNVNKNQVFLELRKNGQLVDGKIVQLSIGNVGDKTYYYKSDLGETKGIVIIAVHFKNLFQGANGDGATIDGIFQISDTPTPIGVEKIERPPSLSSSTTPISHAEGSTQVWLKNFKFKPWGQYEFIGNPAEMYLAAYNSTQTLDMRNLNENVAFLFDKSENKNLMANGQMSKVLIDDNNYSTITSNSPLELKESYELAIKSVSSDETSVFLELRKNGQPIDSQMLQPWIDNAKMRDQTYCYKRDLGETKGIVIIAVHFRRLFDGIVEDCATIDGIFQISDTPTPIRYDLR